MNGATQAVPPGIVRGVTYRLEFKSDWPDPAAPEGVVPNPDDPTQGPQWSGDLYQEGDETDPVDAFAAFTGAEGQTAWLDQDPDGTLTGWVKDGEDVYRYTDPKAWSIDVDGAGMDRAGELGDAPAEEGEPPADGEEPVEGDEPADEAATDPAEGEEQPVEEDAPVDDGTGHDPSGDTPKVPGDAAVPAHDADPAVSEEDPEAVHELDDTFYTRMKKKGEKKSLALSVRVAE